jgi:hypothetical protein
MKPQRKILLGVAATSVVISIAFTIAFAANPKVVETITKPNSSDTYSAPDWANEILDDDEYYDPDADDALNDFINNLNGNNANNNASNNTSTPSKPATNVKVLNNPKGWSASADKSKNAANIKWPSIAPSDMEAGWPITERTGGSGEASDLISEFVLMKETNPSLSFSVECNISGNRIYNNHCRQFSTC